MSFCADVFQLKASVFTVSFSWFKIAVACMTYMTYLSPIEI